MINSKDIETIKELVIGALCQACYQIDKEISISTIDNVKLVANRAFNIVIKEMKDGGI